MLKVFFAATDPTAVSVDTSTGKFNFGNQFISTSVQQLIPKVISVLLYAVGAISVIMVIVGGLMYALSAGDPSNTKKAKDTILYAVIGLVVSLAAGAIIAYVRSKV